MAFRLDTGAPSFVLKDKYSAWMHTRAIGNSCINATALSARMSRAAFVERKGREYGTCSAYWDADYKISTRSAYLLCYLFHEGKTGSTVLFSTGSFMVHTEPDKKHSSKCASKDSWDGHRSCIWADIYLEKTKSLATWR